MSQNMQDFFFYGETPTYKQRRMDDDEDDFEAETIKAQNTAIKEALKMVIDKKVKSRDNEINSIRQQIEQAELDAIAAEFEAEDRKRRLEKLGAGSWA